MQTQTNKPTKDKKVPPPKAEKETKAVAVKAQAAPPAVVDAKKMSEDWAAPAVTQADVLVPKILVMQGISKLVMKSKAKIGDFVDSLSGDVIGSMTNPIEFVPFFCEKCYVVMQKKGKKENDQFAFKMQVPITASNESEEFEQTDKETGFAQKWYRTQNYYVLFPKEIEAGTAMPYILSFRSSSARAGKKLFTTMFMKNLRAGKTPAATIMNMSGDLKENDKGTFVVTDVSEVRPSQPAEVTACFEFVKLIKAGAVKADHSDLAAEAAEQTASRAVPETDEY